MQHLDALKILGRTVGRRTIDQHVGDREVVLTHCGSSNVSVVLDLAVSRQILQSKNFSSFDYFAAGIERTASTGKSVDRIKNYYDHGPLFLEGRAHRDVKQRMLVLLKKHEHYLDDVSLQIRAIVGKRKQKFRTALDYSTLMVELCLGTLIQRIGSTSLRAAIQAIRMQQNIFYYYPHPVRLRNTDRALSILDKSMAVSADTPVDEATRLTVYSLILMAIDALTVKICASVMRHNGVPGDPASKAVSPVSYVYRQCIQATEIGETRFNPGDACYVALVAGKEESPADSLPFGAGAHVCIGKQISLKIIDFAIELADLEIAEGFSNQPLVTSDGAFLMFKTPGHEPSSDHNRDD